MLSQTYNFKAQYTINCVTTSILAMAYGQYVATWRDESWLQGKLQIYYFYSKFQSIIFIANFYIVKDIYLCVQYWCGLFVLLTLHELCIIITEGIMLWEEY